MYIDFVEERVVSATAISSPDRRQNRQANGTTAQGLTLLPVRVGDMGYERGGVDHAHPFSDHERARPSIGEWIGRSPPRFLPRRKHRGVLLMVYKGFYVQAFEREPGKWRANIRRVDGKLVKVVSRETLEKSTTRLDAATAVAAMVMAMDVIDAGTIVRVATEKFWRRRGRLANAPSISNA